MKTVLTLALSTFALSVYADAVSLNSNEVIIDSDEAVVLRTNQTPDKVKVTMKIPVTKQVCERMETRYTTSSINCGFGAGPYGGGMYYGRGMYPGGGMYMGGMYGLCQQQQTFCAQYKTVTSHDFDSVKLKFKNLPALGDSESESFKIKARQKKFDSSNMVYSLEAVKTLQTYKILDKGILGSDKFVIEIAE